MWRWVVVVLWCLPTVAWAEDLLCVTGTTVTNYLLSRDPSSVADGSCTVVPKSAVASQRLILENIRAQYPALYHARNPLLYVKGVGGGLMAPMTGDATTGEIGAVNATIDAAAEASQLFKDEVTGQDLCNASTLAALTARVTTLHNTLEADINSRRDAIQTTIDATTLNLASVKASMTAINAGLAATERQLNDAYALAVRKLGRCQLALRYAKIAP